MSFDRLFPRTIRGRYFIIKLIVTRSVKNKRKTPKNPRVPARERDFAVGRATSYIRLPRHKRLKINVRTVDARRFAQKPFREIPRDNPNVCATTLRSPREIYYTLRRDGRPRRLATAKIGIDRY